MRILGPKEFTTRSRNKAGVMAILRDAKPECRIAIACEKKPSAADCLSLKLQVGVWLRGELGQRAPIITAIQKERHQSRSWQLEKPEGVQ